MEWLQNLLGFANQGTSPFGALSGSTAMTPPAQGAPTQQPAAPPAAPPAAAPQPAAPAAAPGGMQMPGLLGKLLGQQSQQGQGQPGQPGIASNPSSALLGQALGLIKQPQLQPPPQMNLLSGPRG
jgi:hypothetical protein